MKVLLKNAGRIITVDTKGKNYKTGKELESIGALENHSILIENGIIKDILNFRSSVKVKSEKVIDLKGKLLLPGLVECHTHTAFAGSRANEFLMRLNGTTYEEIAKSGGGIISTVKAVRQSTFEELIKIIRPRIDYFISQGITTLEIKSGYGLSYYDEIKLLQVIDFFRKSLTIDIVPTFLGAHTFPPEYKNDHKSYLKLITEELLPFIFKNKLAEFVDAFCEKGAFNSAEVDLIFSIAKDLGYKLRLHTEQFNNIGGLDIALKHKALSVDHLEMLSDQDISKLSSPEIVSVLLPGVSFFLDYNYAPARKLIENGACVAISTDYNPGSCNIPSLHFIMSLAALKLKMNAEEIISAVTINSAKALDLHTKLGSIEIGKQADFSVFDIKDHSEIIYNIGQNLNVMTIKKGEIIYQRNTEN
ncbi:MAG: imidazolonepropionase [Ignavibacteria bacterium]|nr:imidazolonepropionase [Ignavibacteria bacterium]